MLNANVLRKFQLGVHSEATLSSSLFNISLRLLLDENSISKLHGLAGKALKLLCSVCPAVAVSNDTKYDTPAIFQVLVIKIKKCQNSYVNNHCEAACRLRWEETHPAASTS